MALDEDLKRYIAQSPTFLAYTEKRQQADHHEWLSNPNHALWLAFKEAKALACIGFEPSNPEAAYIISDATTVSITRAITVEPARGSGIGSTLLRHGLDWAQAAGYARCAVDFEPQNVLGARFWMRHFQPVCYSLERHVDARIAWANEFREEGDIW
jgi:GNAT superfamily N-acetyltransferase